MNNSVQQISDMMFRYAELFDTGQFDEFAALFEHGKWHKAEPGSAAARQWIADNVRLYDGQTRTKHVTTNVVIDVDEDAGTATASAYVTIFQALPDFPLQPIFCGRYQDRLTRIDGGWHWTERRVINDLYGDISRHVRYAPRGPEPADPPTRHQGDQMDADLQRLIDRQDIADLCARYTSALDTRDWALLETCFTDAPAFVHPGGRLEGFDAILARSKGALESLDASQHLLGNVVADVNGDTARATSYFQAQHVRAGTPGGDTYIIAGSYTDTLARTPDGWKIAERVQVYRWRDGNRAVVRP